MWICCPHFLGTLNRKNSSDVFFREMGMLPETDMMRHILFLCLPQKPFPVYWVSTL